MVGAVLVATSCAGPAGTDATDGSTFPPKTTLAATTTTTKPPPAAIFSEEVNGDVSVICGADGLAVEYRLDGDLIDPETGGLRFTQGDQSFHRVVGAEDGGDTDYLFDGGWWVVERGSDTDGFSCEPYEGPKWVDFAEDRIPISAINTYANLREPVCTMGVGPTLTPDCALEFDHVRRATVDGHLLEIGFDCTYAGVGEAWWVVDSVMVANRYYHPPEVGLEDYEEWLVTPMRDLYGDSVYDYVAHVEWVDGEAFVFDIGRVGIDLSLEAFLGGDNCVLLDWFKPQASSTTATTSPPTPIVLDEGERLRIVVTGDSITDQVRPYLLSAFGDAAIVDRRHHGGTALCDWFVEQAGDLGLEHLADWRPHVIVVDHGGNALTPCMAGEDGKPLQGPDYTAKYLADSEYLIDIALGMGSRILFVDQPVGRGDLPSGTGEVFRSMPGRHPGGTVRFVSTWSILSPEGHFLQAAPCLDHEPGCLDGRGELRSPPPNGHLEALGAWRYAMVIVEAFIEAGWVDPSTLPVGPSGATE